MTTCTVVRKPRAAAYQNGPALGKGVSCMMVDREPVDCPGPKARILDGGILRTWKAVIARPMLLDCLTRQCLASRLLHASETEKMEEVAVNSKEKRINLRGIDCT